MKNKQYCEVNRDSMMVTPESCVQYEAQYDPNNDYAIFGIGDPTRGGIQDMKEKMNMADKQEQESSVESETSTDRQNTNAKELAPSLTILESQGSNGLSLGSTGGKNSEALKSTVDLPECNKNDLPEDKEI